MEEFIAKEFGFKKELVKVENVTSKDYLIFCIGDYEYKAERTEDCGNGNYYYSLSTIGHL